jgi:hypothetical protein
MSGGHIHFHGSLSSQEIFYWMAWACQAVAGPAIFTAKEATKLIPAHRNLSIDQNGQHHLPFRLPKTFRRGSVDADPMTWMVTQEMLEREIVKVKKAKAEHSGGERRRSFRRALEMGSDAI